MIRQATEFGLRFVWVLGVITMMLVPTGICICADDGEESPSAGHEPGCPKVRKLERSEPATIYTNEAIAAERVPLDNHAICSGPTLTIDHDNRGPPPDKPVYLLQQTFLI